MRKWRALQMLALDVYESGREHFGRDDLYYLAKEQGYSVSMCEFLHKRDHNLWAGLSRYLIKYHPEFDGVIWRKHSVIDDLYPTPESLPELPREVVVNRGQWKLHRDFPGM